MRISKYFAVFLGAAGISTVGLYGSAAAADLVQTCEQVGSGLSNQSERAKQAECACEAALDEGTIEALEDFLRNYPWADTACRARALEELFRYSDNSPPIFFDRPNDPGYGS
jgi:hypothetical protein